MKHFIFFFLLSLFILCIPYIINADNTIPGSGTSEVLLTKLAIEFNKKSTEKIIIPPSVGSAGGIKLVMEDISMMCRVSRKLKPEESDLKYKEFAKDAIVFITGSNVKLITTKNQLNNIFNNTITTWDSLIELKRPINVFIRESDDSAFKLIKPIFFKDTTFSNAKIVFHDYEMLSSIRKYSTSIGFVSRASLESTDNIVIITDEVQPIEKNIISGEYPAIVTYALVYKKLTGVYKDFYDFIFSKEGQFIIKQTNAIPL